MDKEQELIKKMQKLFAKPSASSSQVLIGDDTAFLPYNFFSSDFLPPADSAKEKSLGMLFTTDTLAENIHFRWDWSSPSEVAHKLVEMNVSDIYAKGGKPTVALLNFSVSTETLHLRMAKFLQGIKKAAEKHGVLIIGGDTTSSQKDVFTLTLIGKAGKHFIARTNKDIGKGAIVALMGFPGFSCYALDALQKKKELASALKKKYTAPHAQKKAAQWLFDLQALASLDQSDSLYQSLEILSRENNIGFKINIERIPGFKRLQKIDVDYVRHILFGGEDFSVLAILPPEKKQAALEYQSKEKSFAVIGEVSESYKNTKNGRKPSLAFFEGEKKIVFDEKEINNWSFEHFKQ